MSVLIIQKKAVRLMDGFSFIYHCKPIFVTEGLMTTFILNVCVGLLKVKHGFDKIRLR